HVRGPLQHREADPLGYLHGFLDGARRPDRRRTASGGRRRRTGRRGPSRKPGAQPTGAASRGRGRPRACAPGGGGGARMAGTRCVIGGVMQHIEDAGVHSGDSACVLPPYLIGDRQVDEMRRYTKAFAEALGVVGLINVQYAIKDGVVYVLEVNPRGSRTVPFVSKATGVSLAKLAAAVMAGHTLDELGVPDDL